MLPTDLLTSHFRLDEPHKKALKRLSINTVEDLLLHLPQRYEDISSIQSVGSLVKDQDAVVFGQIGGLNTRKAWKSRRPISEGWVEDGTARIKIMWFNQPYIAKMLTDGMYVKVAGKVTGTEGKLYLANPEVEKLDSLPIDRHDSIFKNTENLDETIYPVYRETKGVTSKWFFHTVQKCFSAGVLEKISDPIPEDILKRYNLPSLNTALIWIHTPKKAEHAESARKRFAFEEVFYIQVTKARERAEVSVATSYKFKTDPEHIKAFTERFPFSLTKAQTKSITDILKDFGGAHPMSRLLEGDVGSGKTAVAATTAYAVATSRPPEGTKTVAGSILKKTKSTNLPLSARRGEGDEENVEDYIDRDVEAPQQSNNGKLADLEFGNLQVAYMAPTEILAKQHFESFIEYFKHLPIQIGLITGSGCQKFPSKSNPEKPTPISRSRLLKWVKNGEIPILIGTHALIYKSVEFKHLAYVIIDEQHRFGVTQRRALVRRKNADETPKDAEIFDPLLYRDLTYRIREAVFAVTKELGLGHKESIYQHALETEFEKRKLAFEKQVKIPILYRRKEIGVYIPDFVIDNKVIIELKSLPFLGDKPKKQLWRYLKGSVYKLGLLINFGGSKLDIERVVYDTARSNGTSAVASSASHPHLSAPIPHLLSMTATPIPRTLALTIYGDLDITLLDEMPKGRKQIITKVVAPSGIQEVYDHIQSELDAGRQAFIICPRIDEPDPSKENALQLKSVKQEAERLKERVFKKARIDILHSKMKPAEKELVMKRFLDHEVDILVATSVVEVGVNVPNATNIIIEGAERFGLAQLHQLRGRVIRGTHQAYCFAVTTKDSTGKSGKTLERLKALTTAKNGFELAEYDLTIRGSGDLYGMKQWGLTDLGMEAIKNIKLVEAARAEAKELIEKDRELKSHPQIAKKISSMSKELHME